tara:strand:- start:688 stop:933 length:246 start_codon:yes stop_codon:yes gene_type:complete
MQTFFRIISLASFAMSGAVIGTGVYVYVQRDAIIDGIKEQVTKHATEAITGALPGMLDSAMPELPAPVPPMAQPELRVPSL